MSGPKPGQIRCPTCHRSTPALDFCSRCGSPIPPGARTRPRGLDREELQARIRARRSGQVYRRGSGPGDYAPPPPAPTPAEPWTEDAWSDHVNRADAAPNAESSQTGDPEPFEQWPEEPIRWSEADRADRVQVVEPPRHAERYDDDPTVRGPAYGPPSDADYGEEPSWEPLPADQTAATDVRYRVRDEYEERERRSSRTPFMVLGFLALGALALFAGATFYGLLGRRADAGNAAVLPTPAASASVAATAAPTGPATTEPPAGSDAPAASATPAFAFADGFAATAEPCLTIPTEPSCAQSGDQINPSNGSVWILVTFDQAQGGDLIGARGVGPDGALIGDASWVVPGAGASNGWVYFGFRVDNLSEGTYDVTVSRNGEPAAVTEFRVQG